MEATSDLLSSPARARDQLLRFAAPRKFVVGRTELIRYGIGPTQIRSWIKGQRLTTVFHGVYSYGRDVETTDAAFKAALVVAGLGSVLTGRSACQKHGMVQPRRVIPDLVEVARPTGQATQHRGKSPATRHCLVKVSRREFRTEEVRVVDGLEVINPMLALVDFAINASEREVLFAFLEGCRLNLFSKNQVRYGFGRLLGRRGATKVRPLLVRWVPSLTRIKSVFEGRVLLDWIERGHPPPLVNAKVFGKEIDLYWPDKGFGLELDGGAFHSDPVQLEIDREKQAYLEARGLKINRLTWKEYDADPRAALDLIVRNLGFS